MLNFFFLFSLNFKGDFSLKNKLKLLPIYEAKSPTFHGLSKFFFKDKDDKDDRLHL